MRIVFIRHGKTSLGARFRFQSENTPLSDEGRLRVEKCADELARECVTKIYTSTFERAVETAQCIARRHHLVPHEHAFFAVKFNGTAVKGHSYASVAFFALGLSSIVHLFIRYARYDDEETLDEIWKRVDAARVFLEEHAGKEECVVVVSHALWIATFLTLTEDIRPRFWRYITLVTRALRMRNVQRYDFDYDSVRKVWSRVI